MKALSVRQPWAWLILYGPKDIENRTWTSRARGRIAIQASLTFDRKGYLWVRRRFPVRMRQNHQNTNPLRRMAQR